MSNLNERLREYLTPPAILSRTEQRFYMLMSVTAPIGALIHAALIAFFALLHIPLMAWYNVAAVVVWVGVLVLVRRQALELGALLANLEAMAHAILAVLYAGLGFGFQYVIFVIAIAAMMRPTKLSIRIANLALCGVVFAFLSLQPEVWRGAPFIEALVGSFNVALVMALLALVVGYYRQIAETAEAALAEAHAQSEGLLHNILPDVIADRLKQSDGTIADGFADTSVLFADIADFTPLSQAMTPAQVVQMLDDLFSRFDALVRKHKLEKIKTIGDAYMVAAGVPTPRADHAEVIALLAQDIQQALSQFNQEKGMHLRIRIGINSGPVVAGVIGKMRFLYDLWGDSVNTASRMESHGVPDEIQVSEETKRLLESRFRFEDRGLIDIKGKGPMRTYFLRESLASG